MSRRVYCTGPLSKETLAAQLGEGFVLTDVVRKGYSGGDVAYFRPGTDAEVEYCRQKMAAAKRGAQSGAQSSTTDPTCLADPLAK